MTPEAVYVRLGEMSDLSAEEESPMPRGVDMSPRAVGERLREMSDLSELCWKLSTAGSRTPSDRASPREDSSSTRSATLFEFVASFRRIADRGFGGFYKGETVAASMTEMKSGGRSLRRCPITVMNAKVSC